ncbi:DMT family transporter [Candidatus Woesearchaeota archaeon]|nr:DMT family transporter [Candidatus Woesearchaeota archaeon]
MENKGLLLVTGTAVISGFSIFLNKYAVSGMDSSVFTFSKNLVVAILLISILAMFSGNSWRNISLKEWCLLAVIGLIGGSIPFLLFFRGLQLVSGSMGAFLHKTLFIFVAVFAVILLKEKVSRGFFAAGIALLAGNFLLLKMNGLSFGLGEMMVLAATFLWAAENTLSKHVLKRLDGTVVAAGRMGFGALFLLAFLIATDKTHLLFSLDRSQILWILITSFLLLGYVLLWYNGLKLVDVSKATTILLIGSPITTLLSFALSSAAISPAEAFGMILILGGVFLAVYSEGVFVGAKRLFRS